MKPNDKAIEAGVKLCWDYPRATPSIVRKILTAAFAAQFQSEDYAGLAKELRACEGSIFDEAADALEAVLAERAAWKGRQEATAAILKQVETERDALLARLAPVEDEALVEIAAHFEAKFDGWPFNVLERIDQDLYRLRARDFLSAIRPHIEAAERERCAKAVEKVAERINVAPHERPEWEDGYLQGVHDAAAAIRSGK